MSRSRVGFLERASAAGGESLVEIVVLTQNEERHIPRLLRTARGLDGRIFIVDSDSTDRTAEIAGAAGALVVSHKFVNYALQFQWALDNLPIASEWVMRLDADETLTPELVEEIRRRLPALPPDVTGVNLKRRHIFLGRWIKHGGRYPLTLLRIWRKGAARIERRWMDEHMVLLHGRAVTFEHDFCDHNLNDLTFFTDKHNKYATREAIDVLMDGAISAAAMKRSRAAARPERRRRSAGSRSASTIVCRFGSVRSATSFTDISSSSVSSTGERGSSTISFKASGTASWSARKCWSSIAR